MNRFSAGLKSSSPLLKQGAPTRFGGSYADALAPALLPAEFRSDFTVAGPKSCPYTNQNAESSGEIRVLLTAWAAWYCSSRRLKPSRVARWRQIGGW